MPKMPAWKAPKNIAKALEDGDGSWEDERWSPILLTAMSGTEFNGRQIPVAWQIEFDPSEDEFEAANAIVFGTIHARAHNHHFWSFLCFRWVWHKSSCMSESKPIVGFYRPT